MPIPMPVPMPIPLAEDQPQDGGLVVYWLQTGTTNWKSLSKKGGDLITIRCAGIALAVALMTAIPAAAAPTIAADGIRSGASYALPGLPDASIAQGSVFVVFGQQLRPAQLVQVGSFPLPNSQGLAGTSIRIASSGASADAIMLYTLATQVAAATANGSLCRGSVDVERILSEGGSLTPFTSDNLIATFSKVGLDAIQHGAPAPGVGFCVVFQFAGYVPPGAIGLHAGTVSAATPIGPYSLPAIPGYKGVE
jgi:hypothetical protein